MTSDREAARGDAPGGTDEEAVSRLERERVRAYVERDLATLDRVLPRDFQFTRSLGRAFDKAQLIEALASGELALEAYERRVRKVTVVNNTAHAIGHDLVRGRYKGRDIGGSYHFSSIYVQQEGGWQVVAAHAYRLDDDDAADQ
ncbi:MAG TPA: nuclear transport factor 2 family protein [Pyrinomonadaceae bacterium]